MKSYVADDPWRGCMDRHPGVRSHPLVNHRASVLPLARVRENGQPVVKIGRPLPDPEVPGYFISASLSPASTTFMRLASRYLLPATGLLYHCNTTDTLLLLSMQFADTLNPLSSGSQNAAWKWLSPSLPLPRQQGQPQGSSVSTQKPCFSEPHSATDKTVPMRMTLLCS
jgi:hypothetical protein